MGKVAVIVSVDWEGRDIVPESIDKMESFRNRNPHIPLQHFLNAAYYTKVSADPETITRETRRTVRVGDTQGLHIHPWKSLMEAADVEARTQPNIRALDAELRVVDDDWGHEIALHHYTSMEISRAITTSKDILKGQGFADAVEFRSGAWLSGATVTQALVEQGFKVDASAANLRFLRERWRESPLFQMLVELWPNIDESSQPFQQSVGGGSLWHIPNNGCLADYTTAEDNLDVFLKNAKAAEKGDAPIQFVSLGFHQETALLYLDELERGLRLIEAAAENSAISLEYLASPYNYLNSSLDR